MPFITYLTTPKKKKPHERHEVTLPRHLRLPVWTPAANVTRGGGQGHSDTPNLGTCMPREQTELSSVTTGEPKKQVNLTAVPARSFLSTSMP